MYGRERLGPWWGFVAGWGFVVGKTASLAAMAMTFGAYVAPGRERAAALGAVVALTLVGYRGVTRTARTARFLLAVVVGALAVAVAAGLLGGPPGTTGLGIETLDQVGWYGVLQSAGLLFFAFAGYARVATLGEEVRDPARTIPRAIVLSLGLAAAVYTGVAVMLLAVLGPSGIAAHADPVAAAVRTSTWGWAEPVVTVGAAAATLGALLALLAGVGRTALAMAREGDLPRWLAAVHPRHRTPHHADLALALVVSVLVLTVDLRGVIGFSSFGVLVYYVVANLAAWTQDRAHRRYPRPLQVLGAVGCVVLALTLPLESVLVGAGVLAVGVVARGLGSARR